MIGDLRLADLPSLEALQIPGTRDGEQRIIRNDNNAELYCWNATEGQWQKVISSLLLVITNHNTVNFYSITFKFIQCFFF
jgi:hypothetical protein